VHSSVTNKKTEKVKVHKNLTGKKELKTYSVRFKQVFEE
jgi:hypothetical protein